MRGRSESSSAGKALILSDGKPGHRNQAVALARHLGLSFDAAEVHFCCRPAKAISYLLDRFGFYLSGLFSLSISDADQYCALIAAGSESYYAAKTLGRKYGIPAAAVMLPRGYRYDFDLIVAPAHDRPPAGECIRTLPVNPCWVEPAGLVHIPSDEHLVSLIIGGSNQVYDLRAETLRPVVEDVFRNFPGHQIMAATSRRTPAEVDALLRNFPFTRLFLYSENPVNPIPDFLALSDYVFLTADSTSMISEAVSFGAAKVEVIPLPSRRAPGKFARLIDQLETMGCLHVYDGTIGEADKKVVLSDYLQGIRLCA